MPGFFSSVKGKKVAFIGAGVSHRELIDLFAKAGARVTLCDQKSRADFGPDARKMEALGVTLCLGENYLDGLAGQDMILRTPGFEYYTPRLQQAIADGSQVTSELELFFEHCPCRIVGVTGSDGKTTTTSLIAAIYQQTGRTVHLGGNIGRALLPIVDSIAPTDIAVVELSSFQLISMRRSPDIAVVTNVTPNHLDHHKDMDEYVDAKRNILAWQEKGSLSVLNIENNITRAMEKDVAGELRWFSRLRRLDNGAFLDENGMLCIAAGGQVTPIVHQTEVALRGLHNIENLLAAFAATSSQASPDVLAAVARSFRGVEHRIEPVRELDGVQWYNDAIATSPARVIAGLRAFEQKIILIAGGYDKNIPYAPMAQDVLDHVKTLILTGQTANKIEAAVKAVGEYVDSDIEIIRAKDLPDAVNIARKKAQPGDIVSLSPASASFDAYPNFEAKGRHYKELVNAL